MCDNNHHILAISDCMDGNHNDSSGLVGNVEMLAGTPTEADIDLQNSHPDAGFDVKDFIEQWRQDTG